MTVSTQPSCLKDLDDRGAAVADSNDMPHIKSDSKYADFSGTGNLSGETISPVHATDIPLKHESKLSLLGHGPHGKQVVENLLKDYGEDGVREFCQRWRQVFVEALHPRFLPAGWDIMHSGRRDFGKLRVYNPAKKASVFADSV
ncbi:hypothetical protein RD792_007440 [Penstemon davidsonii]|uniref:Uncharacterized protein n=1 Tax=Penstemon davidsonii TaxID=160366 RepID=A0ABR0D769_9LAMI|nr:hypothetical protein RD792_007440 [Penstemon davidsonii]